MGFPKNPPHTPLVPSCPQETKSSNSGNVIVITELQQDKLRNTNIYGLDGSRSTNNPLIIIFFTAQG